MNRIIEKQLKNCRLADLSNYDAETNTFMIPKYQKPIYTIGKCYLIKLPEHLVNDISSVLAVNYNRSTAPTYQYLKIYVSKFLGKLMYVESIAYDFIHQCDINVSWSGYLPFEEITQIAAI